MEAGFRRLSMREALVAQLVAEGLSDDQVAQRLGIGLVDVGGVASRSAVRAPLNQGIHKPIVGATIAALVAT